MPRIEYILERLDGAMYFTKIDLKCCYHQVRIFEADIQKRLSEPNAATTSLW